MPRNRKMKKIRIRKTVMMEMKKIKNRIRKARKLQ
jgi:hypothetical protein